MSLFQDLRDGRFYLGDCLEVMKEIPDGVIDMVLCDLPYGTTQNKWDSVLPLEQLWLLYKMVTKDNAAIVFTASQPFTTQLCVAALDFLCYSLVWDKVRPVNHLNAKRQPMRRHEDIIIFAKKMPMYNPQDLIPRRKVNRRTTSGDNYGKAGLINVSEFTNYPQSILAFAAEQNGKFHPTQKPVTLFEYLIKTYTNEGDLVLDNCAGSGTTAIAAINTNRRWICIEKDETYANKAIERIKNHVVPSTEPKAAAINPFPSPVTYEIDDPVCP
jgi:site-specific DNA-methyltransferase (adenine-specific)